MYCPTCHEEIPNQVDVCPACGAPIERKPLTLPFFGELDSSTITAISIVLILAGLIGVAMQAMGLI